MKKFLTVMAAAACAVSLTACGSNGGSDNTIVVGAQELTGTFSPLYYSSAYDGYAVDLVYNKLYEYDVNNTLQPALAESYEVSEDGMSLTFKLKKGIKFSNEQELQADDVEFTYKVISDPSYTGRYGATCQHLVGYAEYSQQDLMGQISTKEAEVDAAKKAKDKNAQKAAQDELDKLKEQLKAVEEPEYPGIEVIDDYTIKFNFDELRNDNLSTLLSVSIVNKDQFEGYAYKNTKPVEELIKEPIGTGPYKLDKWSSGAGASFSKNELYSADQLGEGYAIENVIIKPVAMETEFEELKSGSIDYLAAQIEPKKIGPATQNDDLEVVNYARGGMGYIAFNTAAGTTADKAVRQALMYAFDRQSFVDSYYECEDCKGLDEGVAIGYVPTTYQNPLSKLSGVIQGTEKLEGLATYEYDMEKAKALLDEAGWTVGADGKRSKNGEPLKVNVMSIKDHDILSNLIPMWKKSWESELGVTLNVAEVDFNALLDKIYSDAALEEWNLFFLATAYTSDGMSDIYTTFHSDYARENNDNTSRLKDPALDAAMDKAMTELDESKVPAAWAEAAKIINDDAAVMPVYGNRYFDFYNKKIKNMKVNSLYSWVKGLKDATIE